MPINALIKKIGHMVVPDPDYGDMKLSVFPFEHKNNIQLPKAFKMWEESINYIMRHVPIAPVRTQNNHYVTIDSKFFTTDGFLRREGVHADGNFCVDPEFGSSRPKPKPQPKPQPPIEQPGLPTWGGLLPLYPTWGGLRLRSDYDGVELADNSHVTMNWVLPYNIVIPVGEYISNDEGGILCVASETGCQGWFGEFYGDVGPEGDFSDMIDQLTPNRKVVFVKNTLYFMTSNTPHETLVIEKGKRRTLLRITLNHNYPNELIMNKQVNRALIK